MMKRLFTIITVCVALQPALAESYLGFAPGAIRPEMRFDCPIPPIVGQNCPAGWTVVPWTRSNDDEVLSHYTLENGVLSYAPPPPPPPAPTVQQPPAADTQLKAIWSALAGLGIQPDASAAPDTAEGCMAKVQAAQAAQAAQIKVK